MSTAVRVALRSPARPRLLTNNHWRALEHCWEQEPQARATFSEVESSATQLRADMKSMALELPAPDARALPRKATGGAHGYEYDGTPTHGYEYDGTPAHGYEYDGTPTHGAIPLRASFDTMPDGSAA
jgi:hypothetical protein